MPYDKTPRLRGRKLQERNARVRARDKMCVIHKAKHIAKPIDEIDHIIPLFKGGADTEANCQGLCKECHDNKSVAERGDKRKFYELQGLDWV